MTPLMIQLRELTENDVTIEMSIEPEERSVRGHFESDDPESDRKLEQEIVDRLERGDQWAWCCVMVTASWKGFKGIDTLGGCSYLSEEDFKQDGYYEGMKAEALADLNKKLHQTYELVRELIQ